MSASREQTSTRTGRERTGSSILSEIFMVSAGGFMNAYSYNCRGKVFASMETGNIVLMSVNLAQGNLAKVLHYIVPITCFALGVIIAEAVRVRESKISTIRREEMVLMIEALVMAAVAFIPESLNLAANSVIGMIAGLQYVTFATFRGNAIATTMCTGNLKSGTQNLFRYFETKDREYLGNAGWFFGGILMFIAGVLIGSFSAGYFGMKASMIAAAAFLLELIHLVARRKYA